MLDGAPEDSRWAGLFLPAPRLGLLAGFGPSPHVQTEMKGPVRWPPPAKPGLPDGALPDVLTPLSLRLTRAHQSVEEDRRLRGNGGAVLSDCDVCAPRANNKPTQTSGHAHNLPDLTAFQHQMEAACPRMDNEGQMFPADVSWSQTRGDEVTILRLGSEGGRSG